MKPINDGLGVFLQGLASKLYLQNKYFNLVVLIKNQVTTSYLSLSLSLVLKERIFPSITGVFPLINLNSLRSCSLPFLMLSSLQSPTGSLSSFPIQFIIIYVIFGMLKFWCALIPSILRLLAYLSENNRNMINLSQHLQIQARGWF